MRNLLLFILLLTTGCTSLQATGGGVGLSTSHQFDMNDAWGNYYKAVEAQQQAVEIVKIELDDDGKVKGLRVFQAPERVTIRIPEKSYSPGWQVAEKALSVATPWVGAWAIADSINRYNSKNYANGHGDIQGSYNTQGDAVSGSYNDASNQGNPVDNSNQGNPIDNSNQGNPVDRSNQGNTTDSREDYGNPVNNSDNRSNYGNPVDNADNRSDYGNPVDNTDNRTNYSNPIDNADNRTNYSNVPAPL